MSRYLKQFVQTLFAEEDANATTEYAIMLVLILVTCIAALLSAGDFQRVIWTNSSSRIEAINQ